jgi:hypothetical protein
MLINDGKIEFRGVPKNGGYWQKGRLPFLPTLSNSK